MFAALIIVFREVFEAGLIIGIVLAATKSVPRRGWWIFSGIAGGLGGACFIAAFAGCIARLFHGSGQELLNAAVLFSAVAMLSWHNIWMSSHGGELASGARRLGAEITSGTKNLRALTAVVAIAILREGSEVVLFLYGLFASGSEPTKIILLGGAGGLLLGAILSFVLYRGLLTIPVRHFFKVTTVLITFLAAGLAAQGIASLQQGGYFEQWSAPIWNTSSILPEAGWAGRVLHTLIGYSDEPSGMQAVVYIATICAIVGAMRLASRRMIVVPQR
jgi:high-affinity iron transporter